MKEQTLIKAINDYLQVKENMKQLFFIRNNTGAVVSEYRGKKRFYRFGKAGSSDFIVFTKTATLFIECKSEEGKLSEAQIEFQKLVEKLGYIYMIIRNIDELLEVL